MTLAQDMNTLASASDRYVRRDQATDEKVTVIKVWRSNHDNVYCVALKSSIHSNDLVMKLTDFYLEYELETEKENRQKSSTPLASNEKSYYYVTYSFLVGRRKTYKRGFAAISIEGLSIFNLSALQKFIKDEEQKQTRLKVHGVLIENWIKINETEHDDLMSQAAQL